MLTAAFGGGALLGGSSGAAAGTAVAGEGATAGLGLLAVELVLLASLPLCRLGRCQRLYRQRSLHLLALHQPVRLVLPVC